MLLLWVVFDQERSISEPLPLIPEEEYTIAQLATTIAANFGDKQVEFDHTKADG